MIARLRNCAPYFLFAGAFSLFINTLQLTFSLYMLAVYSDVLTSYNFSTLYSLTGLALTALLTWGLLEFCRSRLLIRAGIRLDRLLSRRVLKTMLQDLGRIDRLNYTEGIKDINTLRNYLGGNAIFAFFDIPWIFIYLAIIYLVHPLLGLTATGGAVVVFILGLLQTRLPRKDQQQAKFLNQQGRQWVLTGFRTARELHSMGMIDNVAQRFAAINNQEIRLHDKIGKTGHILGSISQSFGVLMQVLIYGAGAAMVLVNETNTGAIIAASIIMGQALAPIHRGIDAWKQTAGAKSAYENLSRLLERSQQKSAVPAASVTGKLQVQHASLRIGNTPILEAVDFSLEPGEIMGLVGPNGAGKTSLCRIILGIWAPTQGRVLLDGQDVFQLDSDSLGQYVGYLPQNVELFTGTVKENIARMGTIDGQRVVEAAQRAGAHETIIRFPEGYETDIGEAGYSLSGGQRQRIGLARALYGTPKLVVLDEPNSNLDEAGEQALVGALHRLKNMKTTTLMITHKTSLLATVDKILVLQKGQQVLFGRRDTVLAQLTGANPCK